MEQLLGELHLANGSRAGTTWQLHLERRTCGTSRVPTLSAAHHQSIKRSAKKICIEIVGQASIQGIRVCVRWMRCILSSHPDAALWRNMINSFNRGKNLQRKTLHFILKNRPAPASAYDTLHTYEDTMWRMAWLGLAWPGRHCNARIECKHFSFCFLFIALLFNTMPSPGRAFATLRSLHLALPGSFFELKHERISADVINWTE